MREYKGPTDEQIRKRIAQKRATSQSPIAKLWRNLQARGKKQAKAAGARRSATRSRRSRCPA